MCAYVSLWRNIKTWTIILNKNAIVQFVSIFWKEMYRAYILKVKPCHRRWRWRRRQTNKKIESPNKRHVHRVVHNTWRMFLFSVNYFSSHLSHLGEFLFSVASYKYIFIWPFSLKNIALNMFFFLSLSLHVFRTLLFIKFQLYIKFTSTYLKSLFPFFVIK